MKSLLGVSAPALLALAALAAPAAAELLTNPEFDNQGTGWGSFGAAGFNDFFGNAHASLFMDNPGNFGGVFQTGIPATPGVEYVFSLTDVRIESNAAANARFGLEFYAADDSTQLGTAIVPIPLSPTGDGLSFTTSGVAVAGSAFVRPIVLFDNVTSTASGQENLFVFSASLDAVAIPEPAAALLGGVAGLGLLTRRR